MRPFLLVFTALSLMALAFWAYRENYQTQAALREMRALQAEVAHLRAALTLQKAEWAYLNRPDRLRDLVALNFERVPLLPLEPGQFRAVADVPMPPPPPLERPLDLAPLDVQGILPEEDPL
jgi:hypothetical protein